MNNQAIQNILEYCDQTLFYELPTMERKDFLHGLLLFLTAQEVELDMVKIVDKIFTDYWNDHEIASDEMVNLSDLQSYFTGWLDEQQTLTAQEGVELHELTKHDGSSSKILTAQDGECQKICQFVVDAILNDGISSIDIAVPQWTINMIYENLTAQDGRSQSETRRTNKQRILQWVSDNQYYDDEEKIYVVSVFDLKRFLTAQEENKSE